MTMQQPTILRSNSARNDLQEIWNFIARDNPTAASSLIREFDRRFSILSASPHIGRGADSLAEGLRVWPMGSYSIFYKPFHGGIVIVRVLQGARQVLPEYFDPESP